MNDTNAQKFIQLPTSETHKGDLIQQLSVENFQLREAVDQMANTLAIQKELIQELRNEIAKLKGQKPKPNIRPSKLEGQKRKPDWHKRIGLHDDLRKVVLFSTWVNTSENANAPPLKGRILIYIHKSNFTTALTENRSIG